MNFSEVLNNNSQDDVIALARPLAREWSDGIETVLRVGCNNPELFPKDIKGDSLQDVIRKWVRQYEQGYDNRISRRTSNMPGTIADPIVDAIIRGRLTHLTDTDIELVKFAHRLAMSAENVLGLMLEEHLASELIGFEWYCCWGETLKSVDFCGRRDGLLQVKNRSNSENSSSSSVRNGTSIEKWFRVDARTGNYRWERLNTRFNTQVFSEASFIAFALQVLSNNPQALPVESQNPWINR